MPVTAKLSRKFYETFGDQIANELVAWFNAVDATYRADLRELNELNFARFDAKLEQRMVELEAKLEQRMTALEAKLEQRMTALEVKVEQRLTALEAKLEQRVVELDGRMQAGFERLRADTIKWSFLFWIGMVVTVFVSRLL